MCMCICILTLPGKKSGYADWSEYKNQIKSVVENWKQLSGKWNGNSSISVVQKIMGQTGRKEGSPGMECIHAVSYANSRRYVIARVWSDRVPSTDLLLHTQSAARC